MKRREGNDTIRKTFNGEERGGRNETDFCNDIWEEISENGQVVMCGFYHRYWNIDKTRNQAFDMFSGKILDLKEKKEKGDCLFLSTVR